MKIKEAIENYLSESGNARIELKSVLFDMDGVLYDSMPNHALAWHETMRAHGLDFSIEDAYLHEGRTGAATIRIICRREGITLTDDDIANIYGEKTDAFLKLPAPQCMTGSYEALKKVVRDGLFPMVVTGSGYAALLDNLDKYYPGIFRRERMVTAYDVKIGKPNPEPYLMALRKGDLQPWEAFVVENAPLGVEAARAAGLFVIAVNTGPLPDKYLIDAGANLLFPGMTALADAWDEIVHAAGR
ncbi:MAG: HAD hydrolase-like protein [Tannerella sp.]|jgi:beta-phosphoglucomutase-like phosphatase (HAD superfamily)|nr:HAD hydrolase-like protein [Tannerella sp.]